MRTRCLLTPAQGRQAQGQAAWMPRNRPRGSLPVAAAGGRRRRPTPYPALPLLPLRLCAPAEPRSHNVPQAQVGADQGREIQVSPGCGGVERGGPAARRGRLPAAVGAGRQGGGHQAGACLVRWASGPAGSIARPRQPPHSADAAQRRSPCLSLPTPFCVGGAAPTACHPCRCPPPQAA